MYRIYRMIKTCLNIHARKTDGAPLESRRDGMFVGSRAIPSHLLFEPRRGDMFGDAISARTLPNMSPRWGSGEAREGVLFLQTCRPSGTKKDVSYFLNRF
jgi:hypothetical protein